MLRLLRRPNSTSWVAGTARANGWMCQVPVSDPDSRMQARRLYTIPGLVGVRIGDPILPETFGDDDAVLVERVRKAVAELAGPSAATLLDREIRKATKTDRIAAQT